MSALGNIIVKELRELMTPATFLPIIIIAIIFGSMGNTMGGIEEELAEKPVIGYIDLDNQNLSTIATNLLDLTSEVVYNSTDKEKGIKTLRENDGVALIIINQGFSENILSGKQGEIEVYWVMKGAGILDSISSSVVEELIKQIDLNITRELITTDSSRDVNSTLAPTNITQTTQFKNVELTGLSPNDVAGILSSQSTFIPIVIMMIIIMSGGMVISSMALEKENKTLETLLTLPVKRTSIVAGKIIASAIIGLILAVIYMFGIGYYLQSFQMQGGKSLADYGLALSSTDLLIIGASVFVTLIAALSLCMLLGTMAKKL